ncbi:hypothetical protein TBLA_0D02730 [Henningerozyma blattae CBS 6284]|uniref:non-specific serine/threonine protein kinase n=1 Tax=Henningerozyma blattae (strain ATCC 34711 / CBS 6284 / DSM 70876 / NBRC 10599 / NRRL Y-10934 / UCD 77-7) TaxID=1071380 RepID=I2H324_HENB6|nr:hypothetical protein TBLA_0D02730 [Tetrapisispora blattae CBS 6284]CCH60776.1 hypothetical protein TBLA_0D02730 [Tetrapisispora blattae CBS 6284]
MTCHKHSAIHCRINNYTLTEQVGSGAYGLVFRAIDTHVPTYRSGQVANTVAIKAVLKKNVNGDRTLDDATKTRYLTHQLYSYFQANHSSLFLKSIDLDLLADEYNPKTIEWIRKCPFLREVSLQLRVNHLQHVVHVHKVLDSPVATFIVMDYYPLDLFTSIVDCKHFAKNPFLIKKVFVQLALTILNCAQLGVFHCDIKPENVLLDSQFNVKLCDFGLATTQRVLPANVSVGSSYYMAPEKIQNSAVPSVPYYYRTELGDIWSLGIILINLTCVRNPWLQADSQADHTFRCYTRDSSVLSRILPISPQLNSLLADILSLNPDKRPSLSELIYRVLHIDCLAPQGTPLGAERVPVFNSLYDIGPLDDYLGLQDLSIRSVSISSASSTYISPLASPKSSNNNDNSNNTSTTNLLNYKAHANSNLHSHSVSPSPSFLSNGSSIISLDSLSIHDTKYTTAQTHRNNDWINWNNNANKMILN